MAKHNSSASHSIFGYFVMLVAGALIAVLLMVAFYNVPSANSQTSAQLPAQSQSPSQLSYSGQPSSGNYSYGIIEKTVPALAVNSQNDTGSVENLTVKLILGTVTY